MNVLILFSKSSELDQVYQNNQVAGEENSSVLLLF